jgi:hypothetical protein
VALVLLGGLAVLFTAGLIVTNLPAPGLPRLAAQETPAKAPQGQYKGAKMCMLCHFEVHGDWKQDQHALAFEDLPTKYEKDGECLKCHATGYGQPTGYGGPEMASSALLQGVTCEACHGPGSEHIDVSKKFVGTEPNEQELASIKGSIHRMLPGNVCLDCHIQKAHKPHPEFDREE